MLTVRDLIVALESHDPDAPLRVAHQPNWPLREIVQTVTLSEPEPDEDWQEAMHEAVKANDRQQIVHLQNEIEDDPTVWIVLGGHPSGDESPYAPRDVFG